MKIKKSVTARFKLRTYVVYFNPIFKYGSHDTFQHNDISINKRS